MPQVGPAPASANYAAAGIAERAAGRVKKVLTRRESEKEMKLAREQPLERSAARNSCKRLRHLPAAYRILSRTCLAPNCCCRRSSSYWRMLLNPKPTGQPANAAIRPGVQLEWANIIGSHDDAF